MGVFLFRFWAIFSKNVYYQTIKLGLQAYCRYFDMCVRETTPVGQIFGPFLAQIG